MELMLHSLYHNLKDKISLIPLAGTDGFYRMVRWIQFDEYSSNLHLLRSGDLVITTDYNDPADSDALIRHIKYLADLDASGLIMHPGLGKQNITPAVSEEVKAFCNEIQFPIFSVSGQYHIADIIREACSVLFEFDHNYDTINDILCSLLYDPHMSNRNEEHISRFGFPLKASYMILAFQDDAKEILQDADDRNYKYLNKFFYKLGEKFFYFREAGHGIILLQDTDDDKAEKYAKSIVDNLILIHNNDKIRCGIGTNVRSISDISQSFRNARAALSFAKFKETNCISFKEMGFYKMLFSSEDQEILKEYTTCLEPIITYDKKHNSDLVKTLSVYLKSGRSIQKVASELSCHRNTINYRMRRIEDLLYLDINDYENAFILELAFRVLEYLQQLKLEELRHES